MTDRVVVSDGAAPSEVRIRSQRTWSMIMFLPIWLTLWTFGGITAIRSFAEKPQLFLVVWLAMWLVAELFAITALAWQLFGAEVISVAQGSLVIARQIGPWRLARTYPVTGCQNLRAVGWFGNERSFEASLRVWGLTGGTIAVDCGGKTDRFGIGLDEAEARSVVQQVERLLADRPTMR